MKDYDIAAIILPDDNAKDLITQVYGEGVTPSPTDRNTAAIIVADDPAQELIREVYNIGGEDSELYFTLTSNLTQPIYLTQSSPNAVRIDWGDGSEPDNPSDIAASLSHTYAEAGDYVVRINVKDRETWSPGARINSNNYGIIGKYSIAKADTYPTLTTAVLKSGAMLSKDYAFTQCTSLSSIVLPNNITAIPQYAFNQCKNIESIEIPSSVISIGSSAFAGCTELTSITIPDSVTSIGNYAFSDCTGLISIVIPDNVISIGDGAFQSTGLTSIEIGNNLTIISPSVFAACTNLESMVIPDTITSIGDSAFFGCADLTNIVIGKNVLNIGKSAFGATSLVSITSMNTIPPQLPASSPFPDNYVNIRVYVPSEAVEAYQSAQVWSLYNIQAITES